MKDIFTRTKLLLGEKIEKLHSSHVLVVGVGGVGGHTAEFLVRSGVGSITIADFDVVDITNLNRQLVALHSTIGRYKTEVLAERLTDINSQLKITAKNIRFSLDTAEKIFDGTKFDFVVDAIDSVNDKVFLIETAKANGFSVVSSMGAGNRSGIPSFEVKDIYKTENDGLARVLRKKLRDRGLADVPCVCSRDAAQKTSEGVVGSIAYYPAAAACQLAAYVVNKLTQ